MEQFVKKDFMKILKSNALTFRRDIKLSGTDCARVYDRNFPEIPVTVELYGPYCRIVDFSDEGLSDEDMAEIEDVVKRYLYVESDKLVWKERKKRPEGEQHEKVDESLETVVHENGHEFKVELRKYADTGLFLDHANTRLEIENSSKGMDVLNLFSYTGSFSVYAAAGGAETVTSVDLSNVYTAWCEENLRRNGFLDEGRYRCISDDAVAFCFKAIKEGRKWDLIIFDPPAFSNSRKTEHDFNVKRDYRKMLMLFTAMLKTGGRVLFSENLGEFQFDKTAVKAYYKVEEITDLVRREGFIRKRNALRVWALEKVRDYKGEIMKRIADDDSLDMLTLSWDDEGDRKPSRERRENEGERRDFRARDGERKPYRGDRERGGYSRDGRSDRRDYGRRDDRRNSYERGPRRDNDDRPRFNRDERRDDRRSFDRRDDRRPYNRDDRRDGERRNFNRDDRRDGGYRREGGDRDFERRERRPYYEEERRYYTGMSDRKPERRNDSFKPYRREEGERSERFERNDRYNRDDRPRRDFDRNDRRDGDRRDFNRGDRRDGGRRDFGGRRDDRRGGFTPRPYDRKEPRARKAPMPYGYDEFRKSRKDPADEN